MHNQSILDAYNFTYILLYHWSFDNNNNIIIKITVCCCSKQSSVGVTIYNYVALGQGIGRLSREIRSVAAFYGGCLEQVPASGT